MKLQKDLRELAKEIFLMWLSMDRSERQPPTESELARLLGIQVETLSQWKNDASGIAEIVNRIRVRYSDQLSFLITNLYEQAEKGEIRAMNLLLKFFHADVEEAHTGISFEKLVEEAGKYLDPPSWMEELDGRETEMNKAELWAHNGNGSDVPKEEEISLQGAAFQQQTT